MKNKILILSYSIGLCFYVNACNKDKAVLSVAAPVKQDVVDSTDLHFKADVSNGSKVVWDTTTSSITHYFSIRKIGGAGEHEYSQVFTIQNANGDGFSTNYTYRGLTVNGGSPRIDMWQLNLNGKTFQSNLLGGQQPIIFTTYNGSINHNGHIYNHFKGGMKFYILDINNIPIDSIMLTNVDWVYTY